jgi:REP element-mobilizing transposase RayT
MFTTFMGRSARAFSALCHVVFVPKRRREVIFGKTRQQLGAIFDELAKQKECQIVEGHLMPDHRRHQTKT